MHRWMLDVDRRNHSNSMSGLPTFRFSQCVDPPIEHYFARIVAQYLSLPPATTLNQLSDADIRRFVLGKTRPPSNHYTTDYVNRIYGHLSLAHVNPHSFEDQDFQWAIMNTRPLRKALFSTVVNLFRGTPHAFHYLKQLQYTWIDMSWID